MRRVVYIYIRKEGRGLGLVQLYYRNYPRVLRDVRGIQWVQTKPWRAENTGIGRKYKFYHAFQGTVCKVKLHQTNSELYFCFKCFNIFKHFWIDRVYLCILNKHVSQIFLFFTIYFLLCFVFHFQSRLQGCTLCIVQRCEQILYSVSTLYCLGSLQSVYCTNCTMCIYIYSTYL